MILFITTVTLCRFFRRKYDLEQKGIGMYYEMPTTKNFERHSRRLGDASLTNYKIMKSR